MSLSEGKGILFDSGPIISLTMNSSLWILEKLKQRYKSDFYITPAVKSEVIDRPLETKKYKFESIRVMPYLANGTLVLVQSPEIVQKAEEISALANTAFYAKGHPVQIMQKGEVESLAACIVLGAKTLVVDERTTRYLIECPMKIKDRLERKLHTKVEVDKTKLKLLSKMLGDIEPIRSAELVTVAFELGILNFYEYSNVNKLPNFRHTVLEGVLWGLKLSGCAIQEEEIATILRYER